MPTRWEVEKAVVKSDLEAPGRHIMLTLLVSAENDTAVIPPKRTPSLTRIAAATGLNRATVARHLNALEASGWVVRRRPAVSKAWSEKACTCYALMIGSPEYGVPTRPDKKSGSSGNDGDGLVAQGDQSDGANETERKWSPRATSRPESHGLVAQGDSTSRTGRHEVPLKNYLNNPLPPTAENTGVDEGIQDDPDPDDGALPLGDGYKATKTETEGQRINRLTRIYTDKIGKMASFMAAQNVVRTAVESNYTDEQITRGLTELANDRGLPLSLTTLRIAIEGDAPAAGTANGRRRNGRPQSHATVSRTPGAFTGKTSTDLGGREL